MKKDEVKKAIGNSTSDLIRKQNELINKPKKKRTEDDMVDFYFLNNESKTMKNLILILIDIYCFINYKSQKKQN